jgi:nucleoside-diphosphate-sugar epimerase
VDAPICADSARPGPDHQRILVSGGTGFIGRHLIRKLAPSNIVFSLQRHEIPIDHRHPGVTYVMADIRSLTPADLPAELDLVIHQAAIFNHTDPFLDPTPQEMLDTNVRGTLNLLTLSLERGVRRFVYGSTGSVYGPASNSVAEDWPRVPTTFYGLSKKLAEDLVLWHAERLDSAVVLRYGTPVGADTSNPMLLQFMAQLLANAPIDAPSINSPRFNPIDIEDAVELTVRASLLQGVHVLNLAGSEVLTFHEMAERLAQAVGVGASFVGRPRPPGRDLVLDVTYVQRLFHYSMRPIQAAIDAFAGATVLELA